MHEDPDLDPFHEMKSDVFEFKAMLHKQDYGVKKFSDKSVYKG